MMLQMFNIYYFKIYRLIFYRVNDTKSEVRVRVPVDSFIRYLNGTTSTWLGINRFGICGSEPLQSHGGSIFKFGKTRCGSNKISSYNKPNTTY